MPHFANALTFIAALGLLAFLAWLFSKRVHTRSELLRLHLEGRNHLLSRFASTQEFLDFARSEEGRRVLEAPQLPTPAKAAPAGLRLIQLGIVSILCGVGMNRVFHMSMNWRAANIRMNEFNEMAAWNDALTHLWWSNLFTFVGAGLLMGGLLAAGAAYLSRRKARPESTSRA